MSHVVEHCSAYFSCSHIGNGVLLVAKAIVAFWQPAIVCLLQGSTALHLAAVAGHVAVLKTLLLNGADSKARDTKWVSYSICILGTDTAYIACKKLSLIYTFSCSTCHVHVSCVMW